MGTITRSFANNITSGGTFDATDLTGTIPASNITDASVGNITDVPALVATTTVASDPPSPDAGQIWYNTTANALRAYVLRGTWATGGTRNNAISEGAGAGNQTAALTFGGNDGSGPPTAVNESYDGTSWTEVNDLNTARRLLSGFGTQTAALGVTGTTSSPGLPGITGATESWNGTSWTEVNDVNTGLLGRAGLGTATAGLVASGQGSGSPSLSAVVESWNGTSWTEVNDVNTARNSFAGAGISTSGIVYGGEAAPGFTGATESWNGTSWTEVSDLNTARTAVCGAGADNTSALAFTGNTPPASGATEVWNGTTWANQTSTNTAVRSAAGAGSQTSAIVFGGFNTGSVRQTTSEEWTLANVTTDLGAS